MRRSLSRALAIAFENGQEVVGTEHALLALADDRNGIAGMVLDSLGVTNAVRKEISRIISSPGYKSSGAGELTSQSPTLTEES